MICMKKIVLAMGLLLSPMALVACGGTTPPPTQTTPPAPVNESQARAQQLLGDWVFRYTIISSFTDYLKLSTVVQSTSYPGEWFAAGKDSYGNVSIGFYDMKTREYIVGTDGSVEKFYFFKEITSEGYVTGLFGLVSGSYISDPYYMTGKRTISKDGTIKPVDVRDIDHANRIFSKMKQSAENSVR